MATEIVTLSDLAAPRETQPKAAVHDVSRHSQDHTLAEATLRTSNDAQITSIAHGDNSATSPNPTNAHSIDDQTSRLPFNRLMLVYACLAIA